MQFFFRGRNSILLLLNMFCVEKLENRKKNEIRNMKSIIKKRFAVIL